MVARQGRDHRSRLYGRRNRKGISNLRLIERHPPLTQCGYEKTVGCAHAAHRLSYWQKHSLAGFAAAWSAQGSRRPQGTEIDSVGHTSTHAPQSPQVSGSTTAFVSWIEMASSGQASTQSPQAEHFSASTMADIDSLSPGCSWKGRNCSSTFENSRAAALCEARTSWRGGYSQRREPKTSALCPPSRLGPRHSE
jgi:hypothetical protein